MQMASRRSFSSGPLCLVSALCLLVLRSAIGATITVGDSLGWTNFDVATQRVPDYAAWATSQPVAPGDSVVFKYAPGFHNVALLPSKADFDACSFGKSTILDSGSSGTFTWKAPQKTGIYYFACGVSVEGQGTHCDAGQKVSISITATNGAATPAFSPTAPAVTAPPPASSVLGPSAASPPAVAAAPESESAPAAPVTAIPILPPGIAPASGEDGIAPGTLPTTTISPPAAAPLANDNASGVLAGPQAWSWVIMLPCALVVSRFMS